MNLPDRHLLIGMTLGAACATILAAIGPGMVIKAFADEAPQGVDPSRLVRFEDKFYRVDHDASVVSEPLSTSRVKKIEGGRVSYVTITTTPSGTYSTDALFSRHVKYPGITVEQVYPVANSFAYWSNGVWTSFVSRGANSFIYRSWQN